MVATYGGIARAAGNSRGARQVVRILHSCSEKLGLPWHRVVNSKGRISLSGDGGALQKALLSAEGISFDPGDRIDIGKFCFPGVEGEKEREYNPRHE